MATWIVHLRVADAFLKRGLIPYEKEFCLGSVAPDCGYGVKDSFGEFTPPPEVTHWAPGGIKLYCEYWKFASAYLNDKPHDADYYFYLGYYVHLLTDIMWSMMIYMPAKIKYDKEFKLDPAFLKTIKLDWYDLDYKFLRDNPDFTPYKYIQNAGEVKNYLPYYEPGQLTTQIKFICDYYSDSSGRILDRNYTYLDEKTMNGFINCAVELIDVELKKKGFLIYDKTTDRD